ncbi:MAG: LEA type 2 family protein [Bacteroidia bacterium]|nr:LEA type 2 family protein [Bacteroidia bacterium]NNC85031.1 LEA type 2 family protein [Bacteroidia bacterium]NNM15172.1 LEA type 2 family protein [Bacteroidia bacterium]
MISQKKYFILPVLILFLTSCVSLEPVTFESVSKVKVEKISLKPRVGVKLVLNNPNTLGLKIKDLDMKINAFDKNLGDVALKDPIKVPKESDFVLPITFETTVGKAAKLLPKTLGSVIDGDTVKMEFTGSITVRKWFFVKSFPFRFVEDVDTKKITSK